MTRTKKNDNTNTNTKKYSTSIFKNEKSNIAKRTYKYKSINFADIKYNINGKNRLTQKGGNILKHWINMNKFKKFKKKFDLEEEQIKRQIGSYKVNSETFKKIAESKRDSTTNYILNKRQLTIIDMTKPKETSIDETEKNFLKSTISAHDLSMIENKTKRLEIEMSEANKQIAKNLPEFIKDKKQFQIRTTKFIKLVEQYSDSNIGKFNAKIKLKKLRYDEIIKQSNTKLKYTDKKDKKKYTKHKADYDVISKFGDDVIQNQQKIVHEINELLQNAEFYIGQMDELAVTKNGIDANIIEWDKLYRKIFEFLYKIIDNIGKTKDKIEEIKKLELEIDISLHPIAQTVSNKTYEEMQLKESSKTLKNQQHDLDQVILFLNASALNLEEILNLLINEKMASELYLDNTKIASTFEYIYLKMQKYMNLFKPIQSGGAKPSYSKKKSGKISIGTKFINVEIKPICYDANNNFDSIINKPDFKSNENLFIYTDSFENYSNNTIITEAGEYYNKFRKYRKDILPFNKEKINSLGIPIGFDTDLKNSDTNIFNLRENDFDINNITLKLVNDIKEPTLADAKKLFIQSINNIYALLKSKYYNKIKYIYYYKYCTEPAQKDLNFIDLEGYSKHSFTKNNITPVSHIISTILNNINSKDTTITVKTPVTEETEETDETEDTEETATTTKSSTAYSIHPIKHNNNNGFEDIFLKNIKNKSENAKKMLFIYNDNFAFYCKGSTKYGSGNAAARPFRQDLNKSDESRIADTNLGTKFKNCKGMLSLGIPTGYLETDKTGYPVDTTYYNYNNSNDMKSFNELSDLLCEGNNENQILKISMQNIYKYVYNNKNITDIYYSTNDNSSNYPLLDLNTFKDHEWSKTNITNLNNQFENLLKKLKTNIPHRNFTINKKEFEINNTSVKDIKNNSVDLYDTDDIDDVSIKIGAQKSVKFADTVKPSLGKTSSSGLTITISSISPDGIALGANGLPIKVNSNTTDGAGKTLSPGNVVTINNMKATVQKNGDLYFDPIIPENSPVNRIVKYLKVINKNNHYDNNIDKISKNVELIYNILDDIVSPQSEFMSISTDVQELSQELIKLKFIEPKLIKADIAKPQPLAKQYSWVLKPVELIKSEFHALKGTETLDKLIKNNKTLDAIIVKNSQVPESDYIILSDLLVNQNSIHYLSSENRTKLDKIINNENNFNHFNKQIENKSSNEKCTIYRNIKQYFGEKYNDKLSEKISTNCGKNQGQQGQKGQWQGNQQGQKNKQKNKGYKSNYPYQ